MNIHVQESTKLAEVSSESTSDEVFSRRALKAFLAMSPLAFIMLCGQSTLATKGALTPKRSIHVSEAQNANPN